MKKTRESSVRKGELYAKIRDSVLDFAEELQRVVSKEPEVFGGIEISFNKSRVHVDKITLADKPLLELRKERYGAPVTPKGEPNGNLKEVKNGK